MDRKTSIQTKLHICLMFGQYQLDAVLKASSVRLKKNAHKIMNALENKKPFKLSILAKNDEKLLSFEELENGDTVAAILEN